MKIIFTNPDGSISVMHPAAQTDVARILPKVLGMTEMQYMEFIRDRDVPVGATNIHIVPDTYIPAHRGNRKNWKIVNGKLVG